MDDIEVRMGGEIRVETRGLSKLIRGYPIVFNRLSENLGGFREKVIPEAIDRTLRDGIDLRALVDHDASKILGRLSAGTLRVEKDQYGLAVEITPPNTTAGHDIVESINRRDVTGGSFAFMPIGETESWWDFKSNPPVRTVRDMLVRELTICSFPAYPQTELALRSLARYRGPRHPPATVTQRLAALEKRKY
jgi:HK97 family phage prohead protease